MQLTMAYKTGGVTHLLFRPFFGCSHYWVARKEAVYL